MRAMSVKTLALPRIVLVAAFAALVTLGAGPLSNPAPVSAGTADNMEAKLLQWVNAERSKRGIPALQLRSSLVDLAGDRAAKMASSGELKHPACLSCKLKRRGISFNRCGEVIAYTSWPWGTEAAQSIFNGWKRSTDHWNMLMSRSYNRIGFGVAYRRSNQTTWAAAVFTG
jgi:uncharacterized protein YkwD